MAQRGYYRHPTINADTIVFVAEDDLWSVSTDGGLAARITANPGRQSHPRLSPDGSQIGYVSMDEGRSEVYVVDVDGGLGRRLTHLGAPTIVVVGWDPDGSAVLFASDHDQPFPGWVHLYRVRLDGSSPEPLGLGPAWAIDCAPGPGKAGPGKARFSRVIARHGFDPARWKRYRGGRAGRLWVDNDGNGFEPLGDLGGNLASPMWIGRRIYFLSDHEGVGNVYSLTPTGRSLRRHTDHSGFYARFASSDGRRIVYHGGADLWICDPRDDTHRLVDVRLRTATPQRIRTFVTAGASLETVRVHPNGHSVALTARGTVFTAPLWEGAPIRHGSGSSVRRRLAVWLPDGERIVSITDQTGEERILIEAADGSVEPTLIDRPIGRVRSLHMAPRGASRVALTNHRHELIVMDLVRKSARVVHKSEFAWIGGVDWSSDGRWLAFGAATGRTTMNIHLHDTANRKTHIVGDPEFVDHTPSFDPGGRYLSFLSSRVLDPVPDTAFHDYGFPRTTIPVIVSLQIGTPGPASIALRGPRAPGQPFGPPGSGGQPILNPGRRAEDAPKDANRDAEVTIDLDGLDQRLTTLRVGPGRYTELRFLNDRLVWLSWPVHGANSEPFGSDPPAATLQTWELANDKVETVAEAIFGFDVSQDRKTLALRHRKRLRVVSANWKDDKSGKDAVGRETGWMDLERFRVEIVPTDEWRQMFDEAWRLQRDYFWSEDMTGVDWIDVRDRYAKLLDRVASRSEFGDLMWEMQGELGTSHAYEMGGAYRPVPTWSAGRIGADLEWSRGAWRIKRIPFGDPWDQETCSPLAVPGVEAAVGDRILSVDGVVPTRDMTPESLLIDRANRPVSIALGRGRKSPRTVVIVPLASEAKLRYRDWVRSNRELVAERTDGRVGYIHIPDMGAAGFAEFHRAFRSEIDHDGLVVDVRFNRGGNVSQLLLEKLIRARVGYRVTRWRQPMAFPTDSPAGPIVCVTNEMAGSDGDIFSHTFKMAGLGPLIGTRTWGGVVGIWPQQSLVDGTVTTQPEFSTWFSDVGFGIENFGAVPDIELENSPAHYAAGVDAQIERGIEEIIRLVEAAGNPLPDFLERPTTAWPILGPRPV